MNNSDRRFLPWLAPMAGAHRRRVRCWTAAVVIGAVVGPTAVAAAPAPGLCAQVDPAAIESLLGARYKLSEVRAARGREPAGADAAVAGCEWRQVGVWFRKTRRLRLERLGPDWRALHEMPSAGAAPGSPPPAVMPRAISGSGAPPFDDGFLARRQATPPTQMDSREFVFDRINSPSYARQSPLALMRGQRAYELRDGASPAEAPLLTGPPERPAMVCAPWMVRRSGSW